MASRTVSCRTANRGQGTKSTMVWRWTGMAALLPTTSATSTQTRSPVMSRCGHELSDSAAKPDVQTFCRSWSRNDQISTAASVIWLRLLSLCYRCAGTLNLRSWPLWCSRFLPHGLPRKLIPLRFHLTRLGLAILETSALTLPVIISLPVITNMKWAPAWYSICNPVRMYNSGIQISRQLDLKRSSKRSAAS